MRRAAIPWTLLWCSMALPASAESLYVDNGVTTSGDGTSWGTAWRSFTDVQWGSGDGQLGPGDTLYISGGSTEKVYAENLIITDGGCYVAWDNCNAFDAAVDGAPGQEITIARGQDPGHDGQVVFDAAGTVEPYVGFYGVGHVVFDGAGMFFRGQKELANVDSWKTGVFSVQGGAHHITIKNSSIHLDQGTGFVILTDTTHDILIQNNTVTTVDFVNKTTDIIVCFCAVQNLTIDGNTFIQSNAACDATKSSACSCTAQDHPNLCHNDIMHITPGSTTGPEDLTITNNLIQLEEQVHRSEQGLMLNGLVGELTMFNNVIHYGPRGGEPDDGYSNMVNLLGPPSSFTANTRMFNNTFIGPGSFVFGEGAASHEVDCFNNIFFDDRTTNDYLGGGRIGPYVENCDENQTAGLFSFHNNLYEAPFTEPIVYCGSLISTDVWEAKPFVEGSVYANPELDADYFPSESSPGTGQGLSLTHLGMAELNNDRVGTPRPESEPWDIGAQQVPVPGGPDAGAPDGGSDGGAGGTDGDAGPGGTAGTSPGGEGSDGGCDCALLSSGSPDGQVRWALLSGALLLVLARARRRPAAVRRRTGG